MNPQERKVTNQKYIYQALLEIMAGKPEEQISVTELCKRANVSRTYFYKNYSDYDQIILAAQKMKMLNYLRKLPNTQKIDVSDLMTNYFTMIKEDLPTYKLLVKNEKIEILLTTFQSVFQSLLQSDKIDNPNRALEQRYYLQFFTGAVVNMTLTWVKNGTKETPKYMGKQVQNFVTPK
ncbi:TetR/AcrR family transcriptional regulator [Companilactobacillus ginsenosidimutans]|uniref:Transcriptional regulator TetR C-terminal Firmicutes type domain-containing protein n=1 Tax=Companilactobacillus ginsenosidimutans TaxID=1007676 RepID=A0A0H4QM64_9LACO|nr:TetR/AcrR family transcriptional regulator [Companilactobacillus ginsenosidimutans]AKP67803.1 hypothetical protein ABM34_09840 [Companilactobacillus ginsenosidimutans]